MQVMRKKKKNNAVFSIVVFTQKTKQMHIRVFLFVTYSRLHVNIQKQFSTLHMEFEAGFPHNGMEFNDYAAVTWACGTGHATHV